MSAGGNANIKIERKSGDRRGVIEEETMTERITTDIEAGKAEVGTSIGHTIGLSNYSSFRVDVSLKLWTNARSVDKAAAFAEKWCRDRCAEIIENEGIRK